MGIQIVRKGAPEFVNDDELDLEIDALPIITQRKLLQYISKVRARSSTTLVVQPADCRSTDNLSLDNKTVNKLKKRKGNKKSSRQSTCIRQTANAANRNVISHPIVDLPQKEKMEPLGFEDKQAIVDAIQKLPSERWSGVIQIIRAGVPDLVHHHEIDLEIDMLPTKTQPKLLQHVLKRRPKKKNKHNRA